MSLVFAEHPPVVPPADCVVVKEVRAFIMDKRAEEEAGGGADCHAQSHGHWIVDTPIANPMSGYASYKTSRKAWGIDAIGSMIVEVELTNGMVGVGISIGGAAGCTIVETHLARFVEGQDPRNVELIWDQMWRSTINYGRKGLPIQCISAVDIALWDALGKLRGEPVYQLLGGKTKERCPVYATTARPDLAYKMGFKGAKFPLPYGPADGHEGMRKNIERVKQVRASIPDPNFPIMIDCYMALTVPYTIELARRIDREVPGGVKWIEEHLPPDDYDGYAEVKRVAGAWNLFTCGEHEYTRYGFRQLLEKKCCDVLQPDITWCGGITEARRIYALAAAYDIPCIPHGSSVYSYHLQFACAQSPVAELLIMSPKADKIVPYFGDLFTDEPLPVDGYISLDPTKPGFGVTLNREWIKLIRPSPRTTDQLGTRASRAAAAAAVPTRPDWLGRAIKIQSGGVSEATDAAAAAGGGGGAGAGGGN